MANSTIKSNINEITVTISDTPSSLRSYNIQAFDTQDGFIDLEIYLEFSSLVSGFVSLGTLSRNTYSALTTCPLSSIAYKQSDFSYPNSNALITTWGKLYIQLSGQCDRIYISGRYRTR